jgi:hypothetical protein
MEPHHRVWLHLALHRPTQPVEGSLMKSNNVQVRELAAWGLDSYSYRPKLALPCRAARPDRPKYAPSAPALLAKQTATIQQMLGLHTLRPDLLEEMDGLEWSLGVIDLRALIAFQRRLFLDPALPSREIPAAHDWDGLIAMSLATAAAPQYSSLSDDATRAITIQSSNPNMHVRTGNDSASPIRIHAGGPFFEVACFHDRWFLRDGYHRAYRLLCAGVFEVPSVIVHARTIQELGAVQPWFFEEKTLFSDNPPMITDFLDDALVLTYERPRLVKTIRITVEESLTPETSNVSPTGDLI